MGFRIVRPDTAILSLSDKKTITVRRRLTTSEERTMFKRARTPDGMHDSMEFAFALVLAYLLDWSSPDEPPPVIRGVDDTTLSATLNALDIDDFLEIKEAIEAHRVAMVKERADEKKTVTATSNDAPISPLPSEQAGALSGSVT